VRLENLVEKIMLMTESPLEVQMNWKDMVPMMAEPVENTPTGLFIALVQARTLPEDGLERIRIFNAADVCLGFLCFDDLFAPI
jgi:hypothetical protein